MADPTAPPPKPPVFSLTGNPGLDSIIGTSLLGVSAVITTWIVARLKLTDPQAPVWIGAAVLAALGFAATGVWRWIKGTQVGAALDQELLLGVKSGINLTTAGKAVGMDGKTIIKKNDGTTPPLPPTVATAKVIAQNFGTGDGTLPKGTNP